MTDGDILYPLPSTARTTMRTDQASKPLDLGSGQAIALAR